MAACTADSMNRQFICEFLGLLTDSAFTSGSLQPAGSVSLWLPLALDSLPTHHHHHHHHTHAHLLVAILSGRWYS